MTKLSTTRWLVARVFLAGLVLQGAASCGSSNTSASGTGGTNPTIGGNSATGGALSSSTSSAGGGSSNYESSQTSTVLPLFSRWWLALVKLRSWVRWSWA